MLKDYIKKWRGKRPSIFILSGAGLSAASGIPTYRGVGSGKSASWVSLSAETLQESPQDLFDETNRRIHDFDAAVPNAAHKAIAGFIKKYRLRADIIHVTQNVDTLCEEAGDMAVFHLHGVLNRSRCSACGAVFPRKGFYEMGAVCPCCGATGANVRPDVVLFGETPLGLDWILPYLKNVDIFLSVGTSGTVYPAADFVTIAMRHAAPIRALINKSSANDDFFTWNKKLLRDFNVVRMGDAQGLVGPFLAEVGVLIDTL